MKAREISEYVPGYDRVWLVAGKSAQCVCGHPHFPRRPSDDAQRAPYWGFCDDRGCDCHSLRRVDTGESA